jgi:hypothetical protein
MTEKSTGLLALHPNRVLRFVAIATFSSGEIQGEMFRLDGVQDPRSGADKIRRWRCGRIVMQGGRLVEIQRRLTCGNVSIAQVWWQAKYGRNDDDICWLDYHQPLGMTGVLTLDYIRSGRHAGYKTFVGAGHVLDEVARIRRASAIVAHVTNGKISDRLLSRLGWEQHVSHWQGRHWIRRFYDGYPASTIGRYAAI